MQITEPQFNSPDTARDHIKRLSTELSAISESGLAYSENPYDIERLHRVGELANELMNLVREGELADYRRDVASVAGYATPKIDVRGGVFDGQGKVLLVREVADGGRWTLPGGWCDVLETPSGAIEREIWEEAGIRARAVHLAAVLDRDRWGHYPPLDHHVYKMFFVCESEDETSPEYRSLETGGVAWFSIDDLPELSRGRVVPEQIRLLHDHWLRRKPAQID